MRVIGLTGSMGSGKSTVGRLLAARGVPIIDADLIARQIVEPGQPALAEIEARFPGVVVAGRLDRKALAARAFAAASERDALNAITHPRIAVEARRQGEELRARGVPLAVYEAALIVEIGLHTRFDGLVVVRAPEEELVRRACARDGATPEDVRARLASQVPQVEKAKFADWILENDGTPAELEAKVDRLLPLLRAGTAKAS
jgi:dephospho-CoA kinase